MKLGRKSYFPGGTLCLVCCLGSYGTAMSQNTSNKQCAAGEVAALRVEYSVDDQYRARGFREAGGPVSVRGDERRVLVLRGESSWERVTGTIWVGDANEEDLAKEMEELLEAINEHGGEGTPEQQMRINELLTKERPKEPEARPTDRIRVEVPPPAWSFSYDNVDRRGSRYVKTEELSRRMRASCLRATRSSGATCIRWPTRPRSGHRANRKSRDTSASTQS